MKATLTKVISTEFDKQKKRLVKILRYGKQDVQTPMQAAPHGIDSNPVADMVAVYIETAELGKTVIAGYLNKDQLAAPGETRVYSVNAQGVLKAYSWHKDDGTIEFNGNTDNLVRFIAMNTALQNEVVRINAELVKIATGLNGIIPGLYVHQPVTVNINPAKVADLKCTS